MVLTLEAIMKYHIIDADILIEMIIEAKIEEIQNNVELIRDIVETGYSSVCDYDDDDILKYLEWNEEMREEALKFGHIVKA